MKEYLSVNEWAEAYAAGLKASLHGYFNSEHDSVHHIEDLMASTAVYADNIFQFIAMMPPSPFSYREHMDKAAEKTKPKMPTWVEEWEQSMSDNDRADWIQAIKEGRVNAHAFHIKWGEPDAGCDACNVKEQK